MEALSFDDLVEEGEDVFSAFVRRGCMANDAGWAGVVCTLDVDIPVFAAAERGMIQTVRASLKRGMSKWAAVEGAWRGGNWYIVDELAGVDAALACKSYNERIDYWKEYANSNDNPLALFMKGCLLREAKRYEEAWKCFEQGVEGGSVGSLTTVARCHYSGMGVEEDEVKAFELYREAAVLGLQQCQFKVGRCYYFGEGVEQNYKEALKWFKFAADQGHADSQFMVGCMYKVTSTPGAFKYYSIAADQGHRDACRRLLKLLLGSQRHQRAAKCIQCHHIHIEPTAWSFGLQPIHIAGAFLPFSALVSLPIQ